VSFDSDLDPITEYAWFAIQILYQSTDEPFDAFERRSGYTLPNGARVEILGGNSNDVEVWIFGAVINFTGVTGLGNRVNLSWEVPFPRPSIVSFEILVAKSVEGLNVGNITDRFRENVLGPFPYDPGQTLYEAIDPNAGRTGSKANVYILVMNFADGSSLPVGTIVVFHKGKGR
jgi:hypothetical protein